MCFAGIRSCEADHGNGSQHCSSKKQLQVAQEQTEVGGKSSLRAVYSLCKEVDRMSFGENLQLIRKKNQLSQERLAEMLGVSRQAVSKWELGVSQS